MACFRLLTLPVPAQKSDKGYRSGAGLAYRDTETADRDQTGHSMSLLPGIRVRHGFRPEHP
jgi:hypothetical protein